MFNVAIGQFLQTLGINLILSELYKRRRFTTWTILKTSVKYTRSETQLFSIFVIQGFACKMVKVTIKWHPPTIVYY